MTLGDESRPGFSSLIRRVEVLRLIVGGVARVTAVGVLIGVAIAATVNVTAVGLSLLPFHSLTARSTRSAKSAHHRAASASSAADGWFASATRAGG